MNKRFLSFLFLAVLATVAIYSCKKADEDTTTTPEYSEDYFPLQKGKYIIYNVDSTIWDEGLCIKIERSYQMMYMVADTFTDGQGRQSYRIDTRIRKSTADAWTHHDVFTVTKTPTTLEWSQKEFRYIKLTFPVKETGTWKGNGYINAADTPITYLNGWDYVYSGVDQPFNVGEITYDKTVTVNQVDVAVNNPETLPKAYASRTYGKEVYGKGLGLVYKEYYHWTYDPNSLANTDTFHVERCRQGEGVVMRAVDHN
jgi:hypothetical protein